MQRFKATLALLALAITPILVLTGITGSQQRHKLEGEVLNKENNPIPAVLVRIYRGNIKVGEDRTKPDGKYSISFDSGSPINTIRYDDTDWNPATINDVSGARDHNINKVLSRVGSTLSFHEALELLSALERIYYIDRANNVPISKIRERYDGVIYRMRIPEALQQRLQQIRDLYELR